jgi:hypothetical protein
MKIQAITESRSSWPLIATVVITVMTFLAVDRHSASAQSSMLVVHVTKGLDFGTLERRDTTAIDYRSTAAAQFVVSGEENRSVRLSLSVMEPVRSNDALLFAVTGEQCAYSLDLGQTWSTFTSGGLTQDIQLPLQSGTDGLSEVYVRVGGTFIASESQRRGDYSGSILLNATYIDGDTIPGDHGVPARRMGRGLEGSSLRPGSFSPHAGGSPRVSAVAGSSPAVSAAAGLLPVTPVTAGTATTGRGPAPVDRVQSNK